MDDQAPQMPPPDERPQDAEDPVPNPHRTEPVPQAEEGMRPGVDPAVRPSQDEPITPYTELFKAGGAQASEEAAEVTGGSDPEAERLLAQMGVEEENIESGQLLGLVASVLIAVVALAVVLIYLFYIPLRTQVATDAEGAARTTDLDIIRTEGMAKLQYGRTDSTYSVPISRAMGLVVADYGSDAGANLPDSRQDWNTLPVMRGMGDPVQEIEGPETAPRFAGTPDPASEAPVEVGVDNQAVPTVNVVDDDEPAGRPIE